MSQSICSTGLRWLWLVVVVLIIDLGSKYLILQNFALGDTVPLFPSLNLHYARNYGAAFSFLADSGGWQRWFFAGIAIGISVILAVMMYRSKATQKLNNIAYALIIGGALGNLFDRLWASRGAVLPSLPVKYATLPVAAPERRKRLRR